MSGEDGNNYILAITRGMCSGQKKVTVRSKDVEITANDL